jgi:hypothetical protein
MLGPSQGRISTPDAQIDGASPRASSGSNEATHGPRLTNPTKSATTNSDNISDGDISSDDTKKERHYTPSSDGPKDIDVTGAREEESESSDTSDSEEEQDLMDL